LSAKLCYEFISPSSYFRVFQLLTLCVVNVMQIEYTPEATGICSYDANSD